MTSAVISAAPDMSVRDVAKLLLDAHVSAVPVLDEAGTLLGIVSEGDLLGRNAQERLAGQEWWLSILAAPGQMEATVSEAASGRRVRDVMQAPVVTVDATTPLREIAALLQADAIKRVPVMRDGRLVGIVSRADLLRALAAPPAVPPRSAVLAGLLGSLFGGSSASDSEAKAMAVPPPPPVVAVTAADFQHLAQASVQSEVDDKKRAEHESDVKRTLQVKTMLHEHLNAEMWNTLMTHARVAAANGGNEFPLLKFPAALCTDAGREINNAEPTWPQTLRGESADLYARWEHELKPAGFSLVARVMDYPHGVPGDIELVLIWPT